MSRRYDRHDPLDLVGLDVLILLCAGACLAADVAEYARQRRRVADARHETLKMLAEAALWRLNRPAPPPRIAQEATNRGGTGEDTGQPPAGFQAAQVVQARCMPCPTPTDRDCSLDCATVDGAPPR